MQPFFSFCPSLCDQYVVSCHKISQMPDVTFHIQGQEFTLSASAYVLQVNICIFSSYMTLPHHLKFLNPSHSLNMAAALPSSGEMIASGSWVMSSSNSTIPSLTEPTIWWVLRKLENLPEVLKSEGLGRILYHMHLSKNIKFVQ